MSERMRPLGGAQVDELLADVEWLLDDPRFTDPARRPPTELLQMWRTSQEMETEVIRLIAGGPPYRPHFDVGGAFLIPNVHATFPTRWVAWLRTTGMPDPQITEPMMRAWGPQLDDVIALSDGQLIGHVPFSLSDPGWALSIPWYAALLIDPSLRSDFADTPAQIHITDRSTLSFALSGGSGTGSWRDGDDRACPADAIMQQIRRLDVDYTVDLGGVYFLGSRPWEERFLAQWITGLRGSFTLNSAHAMFGWGRGYFDQALTHPTFQAQRETSFFSIEFGSWIVVGLDTAYHDRSPFLASGVLRDGAQQAFLRAIGRQAGRTGQNVILLTHHPALSFDGTSRTPLWDDVVAEEALGRAPGYWYWGHWPHGVIYSASSAAGQRTKTRLVGHGGLPVAAPWGLDDNTGPSRPIEQYTCVPYGDDLPEHRHRILNGFATITLTADGLHEQLVDQRGRRHEIGEDG